MTEQQPYRIIITNTANRERKRLAPDIRIRIERAMLDLADEPRPRGVRKLAGTGRDFRIRVGDYRILYEIDEDERLITVWRIAHWREAYR